MSHKIFRWLVSLTLGLALALTSTGVVFATTFTVNSTIDSVDINPGDGVCASAIGECTLRAAIQEANASAGDDTITLPAGTYTLTIADNNEDAAATGDLDITSNLVINGAGSASTIIDGNALDGVVQIVDTNNFVTISNVTVQNGNSPGSGGGIANVGILMLNNSIVRNNFADCVGSAIFNDGTFISNDSIFNENVGGGIFCLGMAVMNSSAGIMRLTNTVVSNNLPDGGIYNYGSLSMNNSTVRNNTGGGFNDTPGGIYNFFGSMYLNNSTISGNTTFAGGGIFTGGGGEVILTNSTVTNNSADSGGGIYNFPSFPSNIFLRNTIVAGNIVFSNGPECMGTLISTGYNLIGNDSDCTYSSAAGDQVGTSVSPIDPLLGPLQNNGGFTDTHALLSGSSAINTGNPAGCTDPDGNPLTTDQRGVARPQGARCDIGAFELEATGGVEEVSIDIIPGSQTNLINRNSLGIPVAILSTADFDAPSEVDRTSLTFGRTGDEVSLTSCNNKSGADVNGDGLLDLVCYFKTSLTGFRIGDTVGILKGKTVNGVPIEGQDTVKIVKK